MKQMMMLMLLLSGVLSWFGVPAANAAIVCTNVWAGMRIDVMGITEVSDAAAGETFAVVDLTSPSTGARVSAALVWDDLSAETADLQFGLEMSGNDMRQYGYLGRLSSGSIGAELVYHATVDGRLDYWWDFEYSEPNPFGLNRILVKANGVTLSQLGNAGYPSHHEGDDTINLVSGQDYVFQVIFGPNASGTNNSAIEGTLEGNMSFRFTPEPATMLMVGWGILPVLTTRRR